MFCVTLENDEAFAICMAQQRLHTNARMSAGIWWPPSTIGFIHNEAPFTREAAVLYQRMSLGGKWGPCATMENRLLLVIISF